MTMNKYEFDAVRWCDSMKRAHFANKDYTAAENFKRTRMRIEELEAAVAELKAMFDDAMATNHFLEGGITALRAEVATLRKESEFYRAQCDMRDEWRDKVEAELSALKGAVEWERECCQDIRPLAAWAGLYARHGEDYVDLVAEDLRAIQDAARAEVERLIADASAADCEGEG